MKENTSSPHSVSGESAVVSMRKGFDKRCLEDAVSAVCFCLVHNCTSSHPFADIINGVVNVLGYDDAKDLLGPAIIEHFKNN